MSINSNIGLPPLGGNDTADSVPVTEAIDQVMTLRNEIQDDRLGEILTELRILNFLIADTLGSKSDIIAMRSDPTFTA